MTAPRQNAAPTPSRRPWRALARAALGAALLAVVFVKVDWRTMANALGRINPWYVLGAYLSYVVSIIFKAIRWQRLCVLHRHVTVLDCLSATASAFPFGLLAPGMFEFTRTYVLKKRAGVPFGSVLGTIVLERSLDMVLLLATVSVVLVVVPGARWLSAVVAGAAALVIVGLGLLVLLISTRRTSVPRLDRVLSRLSGRLAGRAASFLSNFAEGVHSLRQLRLADVAAVLVLSGLLWSARALYVLLAFHSFGLATAFGIALFVAAIECLGMLVKLTPAGIGQYQVIAVAVLMAFGVEKSLAVSASIVLHAVRFIMIFTLGLPFLYWEHLGMSKLRQEKAVGAHDTDSFGTGSTA